MIGVENGVQRQKRPIYRMFRVKIRLKNIGTSDYHHTRIVVAFFVVNAELLTCGTFVLHPTKTKKIYPLRALIGVLNGVKIGALLQHV